MKRCQTILRLVVLICTVAASRLEAQTQTEQPYAAIVTPEAVLVKYADGSSVVVPNTPGATGVAFDSRNERLYVAGPSSLRLMTFTGQTVQLLTDGWERISSPAVAPDGRGVAFSGYTRVGKWSIYTITGRNANPSYVAHGVNPVWLEDSRTLLFENYTDESAQIYAHDPDTRSVSRIEYDKAGQLKTAVSPAVSRNGRWLAFSSSGVLYRKNRINGVVRQLTNDEFANGRPTFSPDAQDLLFIRETRDPKLGRINPRVMHMNLKTGNITPFHPGNATAVAFSHARDESTP